MKETTMTDPLLLDQSLPTWDHEISMSQLFRTPPAEVFDAITNPRPVPPHLWRRDDLGGPFDDHCDVLRVFCFGGHHR
jgi:hypothetical protein